MAIPQKVRAAVTARDPRCRGCGSDRPAHQHHIVFRSRGGSDTEGNLVRLCVRCHQRAHLLHDGDPLYPWEFRLVLDSGKSYSVASLRSSGGLRCCGGCDERTEKDECMLTGETVAWSHVCGEYRLRAPRYRS